MPGETLSWRQRLQTLSQEELDTLLDRHTLRVWTECCGYDITRRDGYYYCDEDHLPYTSLAGLLLAYLGEEVSL